MIIIKRNILKSLIAMTLVVSTIKSNEVVYSNATIQEQSTEIISIEENTEDISESKNNNETKSESIEDIENKTINTEEVTESETDDINNNKDNEKIESETETNYVLNKDIKAIENLKMLNQNNESETNLENSLNTSKEINEEVKEENKQISEKTVLKCSYTETPVENIAGSENTNALLNVENVDVSYTGKCLNLSAEDRDILERLVQGEAGGEGLVGAALVAQTIRDTMISKGYSSVEELRVAMKYSGSLSKEPNEDVKNAVSLIFDKGGMAVQHNLNYFYAPGKVLSNFHESQEFVVEYKGHRFFD